MKNDVLLPWTVIVDSPETALLSIVEVALELSYQALRGRYWDLFDESLADEQDEPHLEPENANIVVEIAIHCRQLQRCIRIFRRQVEHCLGLDSIPF
jgi:hypothetical protein